MPLSADDIPQHQDAAVMPSVMAFTEEDFAPAWADATSLLPALAQATIAEGMNGIFSFTPDGFPLLGEARDVRGFWIAEAVWITHGVGVGKAMAEWIVAGAPSIDVRQCDIHRFESFAHSPTYLLARSARAFIEVYDVIHPLQPMEEPRPLRVSPFYQRQRELGAYFLEASGWERPQWYEANAPLVADRPIPPRTGWAGRYWSPIVGAEHLVTRERVALYDMTTLKKLEVTGPGALAFLQSRDSAPTASRSVATGRSTSTGSCGTFRPMARCRCAISPPGSAASACGVRGRATLSSRCRARTCRRPATGSSAPKRSS
jgi:hypothetical protein